MTKFQAGTILTSQVMDCQVHAIGKAINPFSQIQSHISTVNPFTTIHLDAITSEL